MESNNNYRTKTNDNKLEMPLEAAGALAATALHLQPEGSGQAERVSGIKANIKYKK